MILKPSRSKSFLFQVFKLLTYSVLNFNRSVFLMTQCNTSVGSFGRKKWKFLPLKILPRHFLNNTMSMILKYSQEFTSFSVFTFILSSSVPYVITDHIMQTTEIASIHKKLDKKD